MITDGLIKSEAIKFDNIVQNDLTRFSTWIVIQSNSKEYKGLKREMINRIMKAMLEPINPRRIVIRIDPRSQESTRTPRWHNDDCRASTPNMTINSLASSASTNAKGCKSFILCKACSHSISKPIYIVQLA